MSKLTFKRLALVVVTALSAGVLSAGTSSATITASSDTLTISATSASIGAGETASVTISSSWIGDTVGESLTVNVLSQSKPTSGDGYLGMYVTDSSNARVRTANTGVLKIHQQADDYTVAQTSLPAVGTGTSAAFGFEPAPSATAGISASWSFRFIAPTVTGTYVFRIYLTETGAGSYSPVSTPLTYTVTVTANASTVSSATYTTAFLNRVAEFDAVSRLVSATDNHGNKGLEVDSALVVSAGSTTAASNSALAVWTPIVRNSSDTKVATLITADGRVSNLRVKDSVTVTITGPGLLAASSTWTGVAAATARAKQVTINWNESVVVYADGTAGVGTITGYVGSSVATNAKLAQAAKTITFVGRATTFTVTGYSTTQRAGSTIKYAGASDSATQILRFVATDAAGNAVTAATLSTDPGENTGAFYAMSSDTSIVASGEAGTTYATSAARRSPYVSCTYGDGTNSLYPQGYWYCLGRIFDSGTVTMTIVDSKTTTAGGIPLIATTNAVYSSAAFSVSIAGGAYTGTAALDKSSYTVGEAATLTLTCKDGLGRNVADIVSGGSACFSNLNWTGTSPTFGRNMSTNAAGGTFGSGGTSGSTDSLENYLTAGNTYYAGVDTAMVYMPTVAGTYTLKGRTSGATTDSTLLTFTVADPVQDAQNKAIADAQAAADAATDAALQAIDAANAATDAANLSAEAADAATVAAEEAKDAADAATAAVEALAT